jgi:hypothetical protein
MKKTLLSALAILVGITMQAQQISKAQSQTADRNAKLVRSRCIDENTNTKVYKPAYAPTVKSLKSSPGVIETLIGGTIYDTQTNAAVQNRCYAFPNGTIAAVWTLGYDPAAYPLRGTGYNFFNGISWGDEPTARIENVRTGWPSYCPLGNGEMVVTHDFVAGLQISKRPVRGTGAWTTTFVAAPAGATKVSWPRAIINGNTVHVIATSGVAYQGLDLALLYYRSLDGGTTWETPRILPGLDAASLGAGAGKSFSGFGGDAYAWAPPKGDTIAFVVAESLGGMWLMKSFDNGVTWTKTTVVTIPVLTVAPSPIIASTDGSVSVALDSHGKAHMVFGRMRVSDDDYTVANNSYYPYTDGLLYWTEGMPVLDTTALENWDGLIASGNLISGMIDYSGNDTIDFPTVASGQFPFGLYGLSLTSFGQINIDKYDNLFVTYSSCREDLINPGANPNVELYRHLYFMSKRTGQTSWSDPVDLTDDIEHSYDECVAASLAPETVQGKLHLIYHVDPEPGTSVGSDADTPSDTYVNYLTFMPFFDDKVKPADISRYVEISPNPAQDYTNVVASLTASNKVELCVFDAMGKLILNNNYGQQATGYHTYEINTSNLPGGMYLFTVKIGESRTSKKVVVR